MMPRYHRGHTRPPRPLAATVAFIAVGTLAAVGTASIAIGVATRALPPLAGILAAAALAFWVYGMARLIELAQRPYPISLDCRDGRHDACLLCGCTCHTETNA